LITLFDILTTLKPIDHIQKIDHIPHTLPHPGAPTLPGHAAWLGCAYRHPARQKWSAHSRNRGLGDVVVPGHHLHFFLGERAFTRHCPGLFQIDESARKSFIFNQFLLFCGIAAALFLVLFLGEKWIAPALTGLPEVPHFKLFALYLLLNLPTFPVEYFYLLKERPRSIVIWGVATFGLHILALFVPIRLGFGLEGSITALVVLSGLKFAWTAGLALRFGRVGFDKKIILSYLLFCAPLMLSNVVSNLMLLFDNWLVGWHFGDPAVFAVYRYGAREFPLATALVGALGVAMIPLLSSSPALGLEELESQVAATHALAFPADNHLVVHQQTAFSYCIQSGFCGQCGLVQHLPAHLGEPGAFTRFHCAVQRRFEKYFLGQRGRVMRQVCARFCVHPNLGVAGFGLLGSAFLLGGKTGVNLDFGEQKHGVRTSDWLDWKWYLGYGVALLGGYWVSFWF
jgi:hypothetical protein